jgi:hypothetical protein
VRYLHSRSQCTSYQHRQRTLKWRREDLNISQRFSSSCLIPPSGEYSFPVCRPFSLILPVSYPRPNPHRHSPRRVGRTPFTVTSRRPSYARVLSRTSLHALSTPSSSNSTVKLPHFVAYALHRAKLHSSVTVAALVLLQQLKARFPNARGSSGHRLFVSAFMLASKVICDDTYSKSWFIVAQGMFQLSTRWKG